MPSCTVRRGLARRDAAWPPRLAVCGACSDSRAALAQAVGERLRNDGLEVLSFKLAGGESDEASGQATDGPDAIKSDVAIVDAQAAPAMPMLWALAPGESSTGTAGDNVLGAFGVEPPEVERSAAAVRQWLCEWHRCMPIAVGILIGGKSTRMGRPKTMLPFGGDALLSHVVSVAQRISPCVALLGSGRAPESLGSLPRLADAAGVAGPLAGIVAAFRWLPHHRWIILPCDLPQIDEQRLRGLLDETGPGRWAVMPKLAGRDFPEPLGAVYDPPMGPLFEDEAAARTQTPWRAIKRAKMQVVNVLPEAADGWRDANTPEEWAERSRAHPAPTWRAKPTDEWK